MGPLLMAGLGLGANLLSGLFGSSAEARRRERLRQEMLRTLDPLQSSVMAMRLGPTSAQGSLIGASGQAAQQQLAGSGILNSSVAPARVAASIAPIMAGRDQDILNRLESIAAAKRSIYADTSSPGMGAAFAGSLGDVGGYLAGESGRMNQLDMFKQFMASMPGFQTQPQQPTEPQAPMGTSQIGALPEDPMAQFVQGYRDAMRRRELMGAF